MGSIQQEPLLEEGKRPITVLVTGFGPFQERYPVNPSYEITRALPSVLPPTGLKDRPIQIIAYGSPIRVSYADAQELVPALLEAYSETVDLVMHIGMASGRTHYAAERYAHRDGYSKHKDLDSAVPDLEEHHAKYGDCPERMETGLDYGKVLQRWQTLVKESPESAPEHGADCQASDNAGFYLCDYTYLTTLAWYGRRNGRLEGGKPIDRPVIFFHVPGESDEESLKRGTGVAKALIRAMAENFAESLQ